MEREDDANGWVVSLVKKSGFETKGVSVGMHDLGSIHRQRRQGAPNERPPCSEIATVLIRPALCGKDGNFVALSGERRG